MHDQQKVPSYYTVIPAFVRYNSELTDFDKLMYGEIAALTNANNYCWASNKFFARIFNKSVSTITRSVQRLLNAGVVSSELNHENGTQRILRLKTPLGKNAQGGVGKNDHSRARPSTRTNNTRYNTLDIPWFKDYLKDSKTEDETK